MLRVSSDDDNHAHDDDDFNLKELMLMICS